MRSAIETQSKDGRALLRSGELGAALIRLAELAAEMEREDRDGREDPAVVSPGAHLAEERR